MAPTPPARPTQAVILAGGRGARLAPLTDLRPKAMVPVAGRPFLAHLLDLLRDWGMTRVLLLLGYRAESVIEHFGEGAGLGVDVAYTVTPPGVQTLTRLRAAEALLDRTLLLAYCDNYVPLDMDQMWQRFLASDAAVQVAAYAGADPRVRHNLRVEADGAVDAYDPGRTGSGLNAVDLGFAIVDRDRLGPLPAGDLPFEHAVYPALVRAQRLRAYVTAHRYYGVGSLDRLPAAERFFARHPTVILDRDGVLNRRMPTGEYVRDPGGFVWLDGALDGLARLTAAGFRIVIVTNQAGVARGAMSDGDLAAVHRRLLDEAAAANAVITRIYHCPHGWDEGCGCRKPAPGMLLRAQHDFDLDLSRTVVVGDDPRDGAAAAAAGCPYRQVSPGYGLREIADDLIRRMPR